MMRQHATPTSTSVVTGTGPAAYPHARSNILSIVVLFFLASSKPEPLPLILKARFTTTHILYLICPLPHPSQMYKRRTRQSHTHHLATGSHSSIQHTKRHVRIIDSPESQKCTAIT